MTNPFIVGAEVYHDAHSYGSRTSMPRIVKIAKVYKNGNFVLEGSTAQFRPNSNGYAHATGDRHYGRNLVRLVTEESTKAYRDEIEQVELESRAAAVQRALTSLRPQYLSLEDVNILEGVVERIKGRP